MISMSVRKYDGSRIQFCNAADPVASTVHHHGVASMFDQQGAMPTMSRRADVDLSSSAEIRQLHGGEKR
jgi:hypothetical protein